MYSLGESLPSTLFKAQLAKVPLCCFLRRPHHRRGHLPLDDHLMHHYQLQSDHDSTVPLHLFPESQMVEINRQRRRMMVLGPW